MPARRFTVVIPLVSLSFFRFSTCLISEPWNSSTHMRTWTFSDSDADRDAMLERARAAGVGTLLAIGNGPGPEKLDAAVPFAEQHDWIYAAVGIHPHEAKHATPHTPAELWNRLAQTSERHRLGRNRPRLSLRSFSARRAGEGFSRSTGSGPRRETPHHHPLPGSLAGLPEDSG